MYVCGGDAEYSGYIKRERKRQKGEGMGVKRQEKIDGGGLPRYLVCTCAASP